MTALGLALVAGLAGLWIWTVLNDDEGILAPLTRLLRRTAVTNKWMVCPWCSGAWFSGGLSILIYHPTWGDSIVNAIAAAAVCGVLGSYFQGD